MDDIVEAFHLKNDCKQILHDPNKGLRVKILICFSKSMCRQTAQRSIQWLMHSVIL